MTVQTPMRPQAEVEWALLNLLHHVRSLPTQRAYVILAQHFSLTAEERHAKIDGQKQELAWENLCRFARRRLVDQGLMNPGPRGMWSISAKGDETAKHRSTAYRSTIHTLEELGL